MDSDGANTDGSVPIPSTSKSSHPRNPTFRPGPGSSRYKCAHCNRRYSRPEHLVRHMRAHTEGRQYACEICGKAFARVDVWKRHVAGHTENMQGGTESSQVPYSTGRGTQKPMTRSSRVSYACRACATARVKCDESKPCDRCRKRGIICETGTTRVGHGLQTFRNHQASNRVHTEGQPAVYARLTPELESPALQVASPPPVGEADSSSDALVVEDIIMEGSRNPDGNTRFETNGHATRSQMINTAVFPFYDFIKDVMNTNAGEASQNLNEVNQTPMLDICWDGVMPYSDADFDLANFYSIDETFSDLLPDAARQPLSPHSVADVSSIHKRVIDIWAESPWQWNPNQLDGARQEQSQLPLSPQETSSPQLQEAGKRAERVIRERLDDSTRDRVLGMVLDIYKSSELMGRVAGSFPSTPLMDSLLNLFMASQGRYDPHALHYGTLSINQLPPQLLAGMMAAGAVLTSVPALRRFGFAVQELLRPALVKIWDHDNCQTRDILLIQAFVIYLDIGLWSCNRRKMELAYAHSQPSITMLREAGRFKRYLSPNEMPSPDDEGEILEQKWRSWVKGESSRRLVWKYFIQEAQKSMGMAMMPLISYSELALDLPCPHEAWMARDSQSWKVALLPNSNDSHCQTRPPNLHDGLRDLASFTAGNPRIDLQLSALIYLHAIWGMIYEYKQMEGVLRPRSPSLTTFGPSTIVLSSRHQEIRQLLVQFEFTSSDWLKDSNCHQTEVVLHLLFLNLHVFYDDIQLFLGREGEDTARNIYPVLQKWVDSQDARHAIWHAGQIFRAARFFPPKQLKDFYALAVYQACLVLWTYSVIVRSKANDHPHDSARKPVIFLDDPVSVESQKFIAIGQANAKITGAVVNDVPQKTASLDDPRGCMEIVHEILQMNNQESEGQSTELRPLIVESLCGLIKQLGLAANAVDTRSAFQGSTIVL